MLPVGPNCDTPACALIHFASCARVPRYAGYPLLLQAVALPDEDGSSNAGNVGATPPAELHFLSPEAAPQLQAATELCWLTCAASRLNGEELTRAGGLRLLGRLLMRCIARERRRRQRAYAAARSHRHHAVSNAITAPH